MFSLSNTNTDDVNEVLPIKRSTFIIKNLIFIGICFILLILMIITLSIMKNIPTELFFSILLSIIAIVILIGIYFIKFLIKLKKINNKIIPSMSKNILTRIVNITSISLTIVTVLFSSLIMSPLNFGYGSFGTFILFSILISTIIWIITLIIYLLINIINFIWKKSSSIRQQFSFGIISFFLGSFLTCPLFMLITGLMSSSTSIAFGLGFGLSLSYTLFISGIITIIYYHSKFLNYLLCLIGCIGIILIYWFYFNNGFHMKINVIIPLERYPNNLTNDPSLNGNYSYSFLTYGSGFDQRIDYGIKASIKTPTIDLSSIIKLSSFNKKFFQYNESALPLNGRIWYPTNKITGPYPVVVMLHGSHVSTESSEIGYDYLGQMLASQGFICVSIDENFLNIDPFYSPTESGKILKIKKYSSGLNNGPGFIARAIILLETLKQFQIWNQEITNQFYNQFDLLNIGLMGHSVAGESITIAYLLNKLKYLPEYPSDTSFNNYNFGIKVLFSISGTDNGYMPLGRNLQLNDVTMFGIHGIYDGDLSTFLFQSKLKNLKFTTNNSYYFKSSLYVHQANHGQFNTIWGKYDLIYGANHFLNIYPLLKLEEQQHICKIYMSALMNIVLKNETQYRILFEDYRSGLSYLPYTNYISTFQDSNERIIADFENYDVTQGTIIGSQINVTNLLLWSSIYIQVYQSSMLILQSIQNLTGIYTIQLQNSINGSAIRFMIGRTSDGLVDYLTVSVQYENQTNESFPIHVLPALTKKVFKTISQEYVTAVQTISLPLLHYPIIALQFIINGTNAQFLIDNIVIVN